MAARAINSATITCSLLSIPIKVYTSARSGKVSFNMMSPAGNRVKQLYVDAETGEEVKRGDTIKGYEYSKGQYVLFTQEEYNAILDVNTSKTIDIVEFISKEQVPPVSCQKTYYLGPDKNAEKGYGLLTDAMLEQGVVAIAQWSNRGRDHLVVLSPYKTEDLYGLLLQQIYYPSEIQPFTDIGMPRPEISHQERELAAQLIEKFKADGFDGSKYVDECSDRVQSIVQKKIEGEDVLPLTDPSSTNMIDLMQQLKQSLDAASAVQN